MPCSMGIILTYFVQVLGTLWPGGGKAPALLIRAFAPPLGDGEKLPSGPITELGLGEEGGWGRSHRLDPWDSRKAHREPGCTDRRLPPLLAQCLRLGVHRQDSSSLHTYFFCVCCPVCVSFSLQTAHAYAYGHTCVCVCGGWCVNSALGTLWGPREWCEHWPRPLDSGTLWAPESRRRGPSGIRNKKMREDPGGEGGSAPAALSKQVPTGPPAHNTKELRDSLQGSGQVLPLNLTTLSTAPPRECTLLASCSWCIQSRAPGSSPRWVLGVRTPPPPMGHTWQIWSVALCPSHTQPPSAPGQLLPGLQCSDL